MTENDRVNVDLMRKVLDHITKHPEQHDQSGWGAQNPECGTTACFAGWAGLTTGRAYWGPELRAGRRSLLFVDSENRPQDPSDCGQELLGLDDCEAEYLFHEAETLADVWHLCERITDGAIAVPDDMRSEAIADWAGEVLA